MSVLERIGCNDVSGRSNWHVGCSRLRVMPYQKIGDVLDRVRALHRALQRRYAQGANLQSDERVQMLLQRMASQEQDLAAALDAFGEEEAAVRDTWLQYVPLEQVE